MDLLDLCLHVASGKRTFSFLPVFHELWNTEVSGQVGFSTLTTEKSTVISSK